MIVTTIMISATADAPRATFVNATTITIRDSKVDSRVTKKIDKIHLSFFSDSKECNCAQLGAALD
jgi:hypothetical protein